MDYIKLFNVTKKIRGRTVLEGITLTLQKGAIYGLRGTNGSGKTMLLRAILGLIRLSDGKVEVCGELILAEKRFPVSTGLLLENPSLVFEFNAYKNLQLIAALKEEQITDKELSALLIKVGLDPKDKRRVKRFSLGMKQKVGLAQALIGNPELLILDEPSNGLDEESVENLKHLLLEARGSGATLILTSHDRFFLEGICDEVIEIKNGKLANKQDEV
ncbi:ABC transporter ATP-binding protein [Listeria aquatica]|uniref:ABC transporter ATP-binding protein n=1 Tax=Listeria aquatica TaxID=1494960 RepID=UPI003F70B137